MLSWMVDEFIHWPKPYLLLSTTCDELSLYNEIFDVKFTLKHKLTEDDKARKNALILIVKSLNKIKSIEIIEHELRKHMEEK